MSRWMPLVVCLISEEHHLAVQAVSCEMLLRKDRLWFHSSRWLRWEGHVHGELFNSFFTLEHNHKVNTQNG